MHRQVFANEPVLWRMRCRGALRLGVDSRLYGGQLPPFEWMLEGLLSTIVILIALGLSGASELIMSVHDFAKGTNSWVSK